MVLILKEVLTEAVKGDIAIVVILSIVPTR